MFYNDIEPATTNVWELWNADQEGPGMNRYNFLFLLFRFFFRLLPLFLFLSFGFALVLLILFLDLALVLFLVRRPFSFFFGLSLLLYDHIHNPSKRMRNTAATTTCSHLSRLGCSPRWVVCITRPPRTRAASTGARSTCVPRRFVETPSNAYSLPSFERWGPLKKFGKFFMLKVCCLPVYVHVRAVLPKLF